MKTVYSEDHRRHFPQGELFGGELVTPFERPSRVEHVLDRLRLQGFPKPVEAGPIEMAPVERIHNADYLAFLETAWDEWRAAGFKGEVIAASIPARRMQLDRPPVFIDGKVGYYCLSSETAITGGTWDAARASCAAMQGAQRIVSGGERAAFALCRPPGHHATADMYGGFCFLNNAAIAAEMFRMDGAARVAVLDVDFHHGNGTQDIFYNRGDVLFASLHGAPEHAFPYFLGHADETGAGAGEGTNFNYPMPPDTTYATWAEALDDALAKIQNFRPDALVVSLGLDAYKDDPISFFRLESPDFTDCGRRIAKLGLPTLFVMEGGYAVSEIGVNAVNTLEGFENG